VPHGTASESSTRSVSQAHLAAIGCRRIEDIGIETVLLDGLGDVVVARNYLRQELPRSRRIAKILEELSRGEIPAAVLS